jgi:spoIIIJ-associated protein
MSGAEGTGRTVEEAVNRALQELGLERDSATIEVLQEPKPALLGFGGREARVRVTPKATIGQAAGEFVATALRLMGHEVSTHVASTDDGMTVTFEGRDVASLIGRHGRTLDALEVLLALHLHQQGGERVQVVVDAAGYRARRERTLRDQAGQAVARALAEGTPVALDPMEPRDRRTIHLALREDERVSTVSEGEGEHRHVVIVPHRAGAATGDIPSDE